MIQSGPKNPFSQRMGVLSFTKDDVPGVQYVISKFQQHRRKIRIDSITGLKFGLGPSCLPTRIVLLFQMHPKLSIAICSIVGGVSRYAYTANSGTKCCCHECYFSLWVRRELFNVVKKWPYGEVCIISRRL